MMNKNYYVAFSALTVNDSYPTLDAASDYEDHLMMERRHIEPRRPLRFYTSEYDPSSPKPIQHALCDYHSSGSNHFISKKFAECLLQSSSEQFQLVPIIIIDAQHEWHENYYYMHFYNYLDCLDLDKAIYTEKGNIAEDNLKRSISRYSLKEEVLDSIELENRQAFLIGDNLYIHNLFLHKDIVNKFHDNNITGIRCFDVATYEAGMQYWDEEEIEEESVLFQDFYKR